MSKIDQIFVFICVFFTLVYATIGEPKNEYWSGAYFIVNYITMIFLFKKYQNKTIRCFGISLSISIIFFVILTKFFGLDINRQYSIIPFFIGLITTIKLMKWKSI